MTPRASSAVIVWLTVGILLSLPVWVGAFALFVAWGGR